MEKLVTERSSTSNKPRFNSTDAVWGGEEQANSNNCTQEHINTSWTYI